MPKRAALAPVPAHAQPSPRRSQRTGKAPERYRPTLADVPSELANMLHDVATTAAAKSDVPFETDAVVALEEALEPMLEALCAKAFEHAAKDGRAEITESECVPRRRSNMDAVLLRAKINPPD